MSKADGHKIPHPVRESMRHEAIQKWIAGATVTQLSQKYGADATCVRCWVRLYKAHGFESLNTRPIAHSKNAKLSPEQLQQILRSHDRSSIFARA